ncbi:MULTISPECIES: hypothetical protein [unclassified Streptomyces]|uniref:F0F1 ATP synthase subunit B family protein n=1 Tax=unclassified Streptomyces TaxID=2593676 RepID=UPI0033AFB6D6
MDSTVTLARNAEVFPFDLGPLNPVWAELIIGVVFFGATFLIMAKVILPRINRTLQQRQDAIEGGTDRAEELREQAAQLRTQYEAELASARHDAARIRAEAHEQGAAALTAAREEGARERERILTAGHARIAEERAAAESRLADDVEAWARTLAERIIGEPVSARTADRR